MDNLHQDSSNMNNIRTNTAMDDTAVLPEGFFNEDDESISTLYSPDGETNKGDADEKCFTMKEMEEIIQFSRGIVLRRSAVAPIKQKKSPPCEETEQNSVLSVQQQNTSIKTSIVKVGKTPQVSRKDYCIITPDQLKSLERMQFSMTSKGRNENLEKLLNLLAEIDLLTLITGQRPVPTITETSLLGYTQAHIIYRREHTVATARLSKFEDDPAPFDIETHTRMVPVREDDIVCHKSDLQVLKKIINIIFDPSLLLSARSMLLEDKIREAFHYLVKKVRGTQQSDITLARSRLDSYIKFDQTKEVSVELAHLGILQQELIYATGLELLEDQYLHKLHQLAFNDERANVSQAVMHSIGDKHTYLQTASYLVEVMERLPIDKQTISVSNSMNTMDVKSKTNICFAFRDGKCDRPNCRFSHDMGDIKAAAKNNTKDIRNTSIIHKEKDKKLSLGSSKSDGIAKKQFRVNLTSHDRQVVGAPRGTASMHNMEGWSRSQMVAINHLISSDVKRGGGPSGISRNNNSYFDEHEPTPDEIYDQYVNTFQASSHHGTMRSRISPSSTVEYSHHMNSFQSTSILNESSYDDINAVQGGIVDHSCEVHDVDNQNVYVSENSDVAHAMYHECDDATYTMYNDDDDISEIVGYYYEETDIKRVKHMLALRVSHTIVKHFNMFFFISKCVSPEVFPNSYVTAMVEHIMSFVIDVYIPYVHMNENHDDQSHISEESFDPYIYYNEGDDEWGDGTLAHDYALRQQSKQCYYSNLADAQITSIMSNIRNYGNDIESVSSDTDSISIFSKFVCDDTEYMNSMRHEQRKPLIDSGASLCGTNNKLLLTEGSVRPCESMTISGPFGGAGTQPDVKGNFGVLGLNMIHMESMHGTLVAVSAITDGGEAQVEHVCIFTRTGFNAYPLQSINNAMKMLTLCKPTMSGTRRNNLYELDSGPSPISNEVRLFLMGIQLDVQMNLCSVKCKSLYLQVHHVTGHPGVFSMNWHRKNSLGAQFTRQDAERTRELCTACVEGKMRKVGTDHHREHREEPLRTGQQFTVDCYTHTHSSRNGYLYADCVTDLASRKVEVLFTIGRTAEEIIANFKKFFLRHPEWLINLDPREDRFFRLDCEPAYRSVAVETFLSVNGYRSEHTAPRDKHAMGVAERSVGLLEEMANTVMLASKCPQQLWSYAFTYAADTLGYNFNSNINTSSYTYITGNNVNIKYLHGFLDKCWVLIEPGKRDTKVGSKRAYKGCFVGYVAKHHTQFTLVMVVAITGSGQYGQIEATKDVLFDANIDFKRDIEGEEPYEREWSDKDSYVPYTYRAQAPQVLIGPTQQLPRITPPVVEASNRMLRSQVKPFKKSLYNSLPRVEISKRIGAKVNPYVPTQVVDDNFDDTDPTSVPVYWNHIIGEKIHTEEDTNDTEYHAYLNIIEQTHYYMMNMDIDTSVPKTFDEAMTHSDPLWAGATDKERGKFESNLLLQYVPFTNQPLQTFHWIFRIKEDQDHTRAARLVLLGNRMVPGRDFNPDKTYCGNVNSGSFKLATAIAAKYKLGMKKGDLVGAYLIAKADPQYPIYAHTPVGWVKKPGHVMKIMKNVYGAPPAGNIFGTHVAAIVTGEGFISCPFDPKFYWKWLDMLPILFVIHSDDFIMYLRDQHMYVWDSMIKSMNTAGYGVQDRDGHDFVGVTIKNTEDGGYVLNQRQAIEKIIKTLGSVGAEPERLPYPSVQVCPESLSLQDGLSKFPDLDPEVRKECISYPYRSAVGALLYVMIYTVPTIMFILNVLSRYCNDPGPRHVFFMKHLIRYMNGIRFDEIVYSPHEGPYDIETMTALLQIEYYVDSDHAGDKDKLRSQSCFISFLAGCIISWNSTRQNSLSTGSSDSEIKAINHTLKTDTISNIGLLNAIGFKQKPVIIYEDNMAAVFAARQPNMTKGLRHMELSEMYFKEKQEEGVIKVTKIGTKDNLADLGTKRLAWPDFARFASVLVTCKNKFFKAFLKS